MGFEATLVVMAAGMGSRFGGLKQVEPMGPNGEAILDFSVYDAKQAGFTKVVFVIKHQIEEDFKKLVGSRIHLSAGACKTVGNRSCGTLLQECGKDPVCSHQCR